MKRHNILILVPRPDLKRLNIILTHTQLMRRFFIKRIFHQTRDESKQYIMNEFILSSYRNKIKNSLLKDIYFRKIDKNYKVINFKI